MIPPTRRLSYRGFDLRLEGDFGDDEARAVVDAALARPGDRVAFVLARPGGMADPDGKPERVFVKAEFRRLNESLSARLRPGRAVSEGRGYRRFLEAGLPVPQLHVFGEQSRYLPRACALVCTRKLRGIDADRRYERKREVALPVAAAELLARIHAAGLVHGDAVLRNFLSSRGVMHAIDLPRWRRFTVERAERDLAHLVTSTDKRHPLPRGGDELLDAYAAELRSPDTTDAAWRRRVRDQADEFMAYLRERDATRADRHAKKRLRFLRGERKRGQ